MKRIQRISLAILCLWATQGLVFAQTLRPVIVASVLSADVKTGKRAIGTVQPLRTSTIGSAVDGRVETYFINRGDSVKKGQPLAQLRTATLKIELAAAEAELELVQQLLAEQNNGSRVEDVAEAKANMFAARARMQNAERRLQRMQSLATTRAASSAELDDAKQLAEAAGFAYQATQALLARIEAGPRKESIAQAEARVELQQRRCELLRDRIDKFTIRVPFDGFVSDEFTEVGAWISQGDAIAEVIQLDEIEIQTPVTAETAVHLRPNETVRIEFPELPDMLLVGTIQRIVPVADPRTRTFLVPIRLKNILQNDQPQLLAGMLARVAMPSGNTESLPVVPKDALVLNGRDRAIYVVDVTGATESGEKTGSVRKIPVELGVADGDRIQIRGPLKAGQLVVVVGNERLVPGAAVKIVQQRDNN